MSVGQVTGLISGLDSKSLIDALITARSKPITLLQARKDEKTAELAAWNSFETVLLALKFQSDHLSDKSLWDRMSVTTSDADHLSVQASTGATAGTWSLFVESLATTHQVESQAYSSRDAAVGSGTFAITTSGGTTNLPVSAGTTLAQLADQVNAANLGVTATIVRSQAAGVESFHLLITAKDSGEANRFTVNASGLTGGLAPAFTATQTGNDAVVRFGGETGTEIKSSTNTFKDLIDGVDVTVTKAHASGEATEFTVGRDNSGLEDAVKAFVDSYNAMIDFVNSQYAYDPNSGTSATPPLFADASLTTIAGDLRSRVLEPVAGTEGATFRTLQAIGLTVGGDGKLSFDTSGFESALGKDFDSVANLFRTNATSTAQGVQWLSAPTAVNLSGKSVDVQVTQAATRATLRGGLVNLTGGVTIDGTNDAFRIAVDGTHSEVLHVAHGTYTSGEALAQAISDAIDRSTSLGALSVGVSFESEGAGGHIVFTSARWGAKGTLQLEDGGGSFASTLGLSSVWNTSAQGTDVAGTVNGVAATGNGRTLTVPNDAKDIGGMSFLVTAESLAAPLDAKVTFTEGFARSAGRQLATLTDASNGTIARLGKSIQAIIDGYSSDIAEKQSALDDRRAALEQEYAQLESTLNTITSQGAFVNAQIQALYGGGTSIGGKSK